MNIFIVAERQDVMLPPEIHHRESQLAQVGFAFFRCFFEVVQRIVHPAKVPLVVKAQAAVFHGGGHFFKVGGILGNQHGGGVALLQPLVHILQEFQGRAVHTAGGVTLPVDQAADGIHAQAVCVEGAQPVISGRLQKAADFAAGVHEIAAAPFALPHRCGGVFVQSGAVKVFQAVFIHSEVDRHKVKDHANVRRVAGIDQGTQLVRRAVTAGGGKKAGGLVAPAAVKGVFAQRHQLQVGVAVFFQVGGQLFGQFRISIGGAILLAAPAACLCFVNVQRSIKVLAALCHPGGIRPLAGGCAPHNAAAIGAQCHGRTVRVAVVHHTAVCATHTVLVAGAAHYPGSVCLPAAGIAAVHLPFCPAAIAQAAGDNLYIPCRRCPHSKVGPALIGVRTKKGIRVKLPAGIKPLNIHKAYSFLLYSSIIMQHRQPPGRAVGIYCFFPNYLLQKIIPCLAAWYN